METDTEAGTKRMLAKKSSMSILKALYLLPVINAVHFPTQSYYVQDTAVLYLMSVTQRWQQRLKIRFLAPEINHNLFGSQCCVIIVACM